MGHPTLCGPALSGLTHWHPEHRHHRPPLSSSNMAPSNTASAAVRSLTMFDGPN
jgi:hypothetical protein